MNSRPTRCRVYHFGVAFSHLGSQPLYGSLTNYDLLFVFDDDPPGALASTFSATSSCSGQTFATSRCSAPTSRARDHSTFHGAVRASDRPLSSIHSVGSIVCQRRGMSLRLVVSAALAA